MPTSNLKISQLTNISGSSFGDDTLFEVAVNTGAGYVSRYITGNGVNYSVKHRAVIPVSATSGTITTGTSVNAFDDLFSDIEILNVGAYAITAPTGQAAQFDINIDGGASILSTKITIDATEKTSLTAATPPVLSTTLISAGSILLFDIDQVGSSVSGNGFHIVIEYKLRA